MSYTQILIDLLNSVNIIKTIRVSSAQARGKAKLYAYYGATRYCVHLTTDGVPANYPEERASPDRRSYNLAVSDMDKISHIEYRIPIQSIGKLTDEECAI